jgi:hypothetical protein
VVDISPPLPPPVAGSAPVFGGSEVALSGHYAYVATASPFEGLQVVDISDPASPTIVWSGDVEHFIAGIAVAGDYAYLAGTWWSTPTLCILVLDISIPSSPTVVGHAIVGGASQPSDIAVAGDYAYLTEGWDGSLVVIDVSNPASPHRVSTLETWDPVFGVAVAGNYAYLAQSRDGLGVVDISNPAAPAIVGGVATPGPADDVALVGDHAYVACRDSGLEVVDISEPTSPVILGSGATPGRAHGVAVAGDYAYVADAPCGLQVVDISNPAAPAIVGGTQWSPLVPFFGPAGTHAVAVSGEYAYLADDVGLIVCPAQCATTTSVELAACEITADDGTVGIVWETSFAADHLGFHVERAELGTDLFLRVNPELIGEATGRPSLYRFVDRSVRLGQTYAYQLIAVDLGGGTQTFGIGSVTVRGVRRRAIVLHQNQPNPFTTSTAIAFELPEMAHAILRIYDVRGRLVRTLIDGNVAGDLHSSEWDGRDDRGQELSPGVYVCRLGAGDRTLTRRLLLLR